MAPLNSENQGLATSNGDVAEVKIRFWALTFGSIGVVYGDIGTSPLYALREAVLAASGEQGTVSPAAVYGVLSLIFWALIIVVTLKYVLILLRADNNGEGGTLALTALAFRALGPTHAAGARARHRRRVDVLRLDPDHAGAVGAVGGRGPQRRDVGVRALRAAADRDHPDCPVLGAVARHRADLRLVRADHHGVVRGHRHRRRRGDRRQSDGARRDQPLLRHQLPPQPRHRRAGHARRRCSSW